jgi:hypothetical protein
MGGYGSGWQGAKKATVEGSLALTASSLVNKKALVPGARTCGSWGWAYDEGDEPPATIGYEADLRDPKNAWLQLRYQRNGEPVDYKVRLVTTKPNYGGCRCWFICPLVRRDGGPPRRVAKLYLPPGGKYFGSREGYGLTYTSCQESGSRAGFSAVSSLKWGTDEATTRAALDREQRAIAHST